MANFNEEYFKEFTDEYSEYNSKFKVLTDYQKEEITKKIDSSFKKIIEDVDNLENSIINARMELSTAKDCLRWGRSFESFKEVLIYRGVLNNLVKYEKSNCKSDDTEEHTETSERLHNLGESKYTIQFKQEQKQYLKWKDLEFKETEQTMKVLLNGEEYKLSYFTDGITEYVDLLAGNGKYQMGRYVDCYPTDVKFFNDLHLEEILKEDKSE